MSMPSDRAIARRISRRAVLGSVLAATAGLSVRARVVAQASAGPATAWLGPLTPVLGNLHGTQVMAVYFDYHCPYCRAIDPFLTVLVGRNPGLQILYKEFPVLRPDSQVASRIALSARLRGRYFPVHHRLMHTKGDFTGAVATEIALWLHVDPTAFRKDMGDPRVDEELQRNADEARTMKIEGTPGIVTALGVEQGERSLAQLQALVDALRAS